MPAITKRVNIDAPVAVKTIEPPIFGTRKNVIMRSSDILKCLCKRAIVDEILPDGRTVRLNMTNYYTDNGAGLYVTNEVKDAPKKAESKSVVAKETPKKAVEPKKEEPPIKFAEDKEEPQDLTENMVTERTVDETDKALVEEAPAQEDVSDAKKPQQYNKNTSKNKSKKK